MSLGTIKYITANVPESSNGSGAGSESTNWRLFTQSGVNYRLGIRDSKLSVDKALTPLSFEGAEDVDWENIATF
jgi:hypothetical protein